MENRFIVLFSNLAVQVIDESSSKVVEIFWTIRGERFETKNRKLSVQVKEEGVFRTSRGERFDTKNSKSAVQVTSSKEEGVFWTSSRGERLVSKNSFYHRGRDRGEVAMKKLNIKVDLKKNLCEILGKEMELMMSS